MRKPRIGITVGDLCGIGPEIVQKVVSDKALEKQAELFVIGPTFFLKRLPGSMTGIAVGDLQENEVTIGQIAPRAGKAAVEYVEKAIDLCQQGELEAIVTAPLNKEAMHAAGLKYPGHTEILAERTGTKKYAMAFYSEPLKIVLTTIHLPLADVSRALTQEKVLEKIVLGNGFIQGLGVVVPRIAVAGLNPHAGEHGAFGREEAEIILPAIQAAQKQGINVTGPYPGDTVFKQAVDGKFDLVIAHYHDQGLIPLKLLAFDNAVNVTLGLPFIRTSVDHGTAFDIAGKGIANPASLHAAIELAIRLAGDQIRK